MTTALEAETTDMMDVLSEQSLGAYTPVLTSNGQIKNVMLDDFELITFNEAVRSGLLSNSDALRLINFVGGVRVYNQRVRGAWSILQAEIIDKEKIQERGAGYLLDRNVENLEKHREKIIEECELLLTRFKQLKG